MTKKEVWKKGQEIRDLARKAGLVVDKLITGKFMYIVALKKKR